MPKSSERGSVFVFLVLIFVGVASVAAYIVYNTISTSTTKISKQSETLTVALKSQYDNPFDKNTQYVNPFNSYQNPFDNLK